MNDRPGPNRPHGLLASLVTSRLLRQPEVAVTTGVCWVLGLEGAMSALDPLVARNGVEPSPGQWLSEVRGEDGGRTDLEYRWGDPPTTRVIVEAKLGHLLTASQVSDYASRFDADRGLLVVLVPASRKREATEVVDRCRATLEGLPIAFDVWTYDEVMDALDLALPSSSDVAQLRGLVEAHDALDVAPLAPADLVEGNEARRSDVWRIVDAASFGIGGTRWPWGSDATLAQRRYVSVGSYAVGLAVGVGRTPAASAGASRPWAWIRLGGSDAVARVARQELHRLHADEVMDDDAETWLPLLIPTGIHGADAVDTVRARLESFVTELSDAMAEAMERELAGVPLEDQATVTAVLGMPPMTAGDLLCDSPERRADIWTLLTEAARPFYDTKLWPMLSNDPDFEAVRYLPVRPHTANIATCLGPRTSEGAPAAWAWLRVHRDTPYAELGYRALESVAPGRVHQDVFGRSIAVDIPLGVGGPEMLVAVRQQIRDVLAEIHRELAGPVRE